MRRQRSRTDERFDRTDLRNICALLTDLLHKNYGKLVAPKVGEPANM